MPPTARSDFCAPRSAFGVPDPAVLARLRANLAEILAEPNLQSLEADWLAKMLNGVIISLSIGRIGCKAALTDLDLGIAHGKTQSRERRQAS
ncbi:MAG TPA: hypothetical protein VFM49_06715 [Chloroflexia bacterium]|jgi:hypothetical protein|nr:hypothetical protein [Chloroflexia bacterium]